jgi:hypothetical protein
MSATAPLARIPKTARTRFGIQTDGGEIGPLPKAAATAKPASETAVAARTGLGRPSMEIRTIGIESKSPTTTPAAVTQSSTTTTRIRV